MNKIPFLLLSAALLSAAVSCNKEPYESEVKSGDDLATTGGEVNTSFLFNISTTPSTRQSADATQATSSNTFRGINDAFLLSFAQEENGKLLAKDVNADKLFDMSDAVQAGAINATDSRRVFEMAFPLKTNTFLFYGRAPRGEASGTLSANDIYGKLDYYHIGSEANSELFQLGKRLQNTTDMPKKVDQFYAMENLIAAMLTCTMNTHMSTADGTHPDIDIMTRDGLSVKYHLDGTSTVFDEGGYPNINWEDYTYASGKSPVDPNHERYALENKLTNVYSQMTTIQALAGELRAASGEAILRTFQDLWTIVNEVACAEPFSEPEAVAIGFAQNVNTRLQSYFNATVPTDGAAVSGIAFKSTSDIITAVKADIETHNAWPAASDSKPSSAVLAQWASLIGSLSLSSFPFHFDLPRGATHIAFNAEKKHFYYPTTFNTSGMGGTSEGGEFNAESYYYPSELLYFGNSPVRTSTTEFRTADYPGSAATGDWTSPASWTAWGSTNFVQSSTRSVAMVNEINYGTALLESKVKYGAAILKDNTHAIMKARDARIGDDDEPDKEILVNETSFRFTGVLIGGVSQNVGWDYLPCKTDVAGVKKYVYGFIYDKAIPTAAQVIPASGVSAPNYTLVFDNFKGELNDGIWTPAATQDKVYIALEFQNNTGDDFYGNHNIIRDGGYFYLIGELDPNKAGLPAISWPAAGFHVIPPYKADGTSQQVPRVFIQDYKTTATFTLGENSLKYAYLTTPDLRSNSLTFGISVDLEWSTGLQFEDVILGGN